MALPIDINDLESKRFGIVAARLTAMDALLETVDKAALAAGVDMITARVDAADIHRVHALEDAGYRLMDTLVYYGCPLDRWQSRAAHAAPRVATSEDIVTISAIARAAFANYIGHYHADPRLDSNAADAAYVEWAETSAAASSEERPVLILQPDGELGGFLAFRRNAPEEFEIVLNGVHPESQGKGLYTALIEHALEMAQAANAERMIISTQINNYGVQRIWSRLGFCHYRSLYTFHKWYSDNIGI